MSLQRIGIEDARKNLGPLVHRVQHGGAEFILTRNGKPAARIVPTEETTMTYTLPTGEDAKYASLAVLQILRKLTDNIVGLKVGDIDIDDITGDVGDSLRGLMNADGEPSEQVTDAAVALTRMLDEIIATR